MCRYSESAASPHRRTPTRRPTRCSARRRFRSVRSYGMKGIASIGLAAIMGAALASCTALAPSDEQGAGNSPDLVVAPPSVSDGGPAAGGQFTLSATVRNSGGGPCCFGKRQRICESGGSVHAGDVLLRSVRGRGDG